MSSATNLGPTLRSWLSLWIAIHFFILLVCIIQNNGASILLSRIQNVTSAYSLVTAQDYGARPFELVTDKPRSRPHVVQYRLNGAEVDNWSDFQPSPSATGSWLDTRWRNFQHMLAVAADEDDEELISLAFLHIAQHCVANNQSIETIRLIRPAVLSYSQDEAYRQGKLPVDDLKDHVLYEMRVVTMPDQQIRLLPVLEPTRRATAVETPR